TAERRGNVVEVMSSAKRDNSQVDSLLYTQFCDKRKIIHGLFTQQRIEPPKKKFNATFKEIERLRNCLAHANELSATASTCKLVTEMRNWISELGRLAEAGHHGLSERPELTRW